MELNPGTSETGVTGISESGQPVLTGDVTLSEGANITLTQVGNNIAIASTGGGSNTFSTGLTDTAGTITANLSTGIAGGQSVIGGTASAENLTLSSTSNATKGKIIFGTAGAYDEANNILGLGTVSPAGKLNIVGNYSTTNWTTNGVGLRTANATYTNTNSSGTVSGFTYIHTLGVPTIASTNACTFAVVATLALGEPIAGANATITSKLALYVASGDSRFAGNIGVGTSPTSRIHVDGNFNMGTAWTSGGAQVQIGTQNITDTLSAGGTTVTTRVASSYNTPSFLSSNAITVTNAINFYIQGAPAAGSGTTITNSYAMVVDSGNVRIDDNLSLGTGATPVAKLQMGGSISQVAWATSGAFVRVAPSALTDSSSVTGTVTNAVTNSFTGGSYVASNVGVIYTNAATMYISAPPIASTNVTVTAPYSLWVDTGASRFDGNVGIGILSGEVPDSLLTLVASSSTDTASSDQIRLRSARVGIVSGSLIGGVDFMSNDTTLTAPGVVVTRIKTLSTATHTTTELSSALVFETTDTLTMTERVRIAGNGNVGINTAGPDRKLDVLDASAPQARLTYTDGTVYTDLQTNSSGQLVLAPTGDKVYVPSGGSSANAAVGGTIFDYFTDAGNGTTVETDLYSSTLVAATLNTNGDKISAEYGGIFVSSGTATRQIKIYFGGTVIFDTGALTLSLSSAWTVYASIIRVSSTTVRYMVSLTTQGASSSAYTSVGELAGLTLANTQTIKITGQAAGVGAATNDIVAKLGTVSFQPTA